MKFSRRGYALVTISMGGSSLLAPELLAPVQKIEWLLRSPTEVRRIKRLAHWTTAAACRLDIKYNGYLIVSSPLELMTRNKMAVF